MLKHGVTPLKTNLEPIILLQKRAIRIINNKGYLDSTHPLFQKNKILKFTDLVDLYTVLILFKARNNLLPANIQNLFNERDRHYALRRELNFRQQKFRIGLKSRCVSVCGVKLWNALPEAQQRCKNVPLFKREFKRWIFDKYKKEG